MDNVNIAETSSFIMVLRGFYNTCAIFDSFIYTMMHFAETDNAPLGETAIKPVSISLSSFSLNIYYAHSHVNISILKTGSVAMMSSVDFPMIL